MYRSAVIFCIFLVFLFACKHERIYVEPQNDYSLTDLINQAGGIDHFILPESTDYENIPQDPSNPLSPIKVELGRFLFFETGLALAPLHDVGLETYSCSTCHVPASGFRPGRIQGIADGGIGFGVQGEARMMDNTYAENEIDAQGARPLSVLNSAFVTNMLWNGMFGGKGINVGTEDRWSLDTLTEVNYLGLDGMESQNIEALDIHRMVISKEVMDEYGYTPYFDAAFSEFPEDERYTKKTASFALSAYLRSLLTTEAPFQKWLKGEKDAMTEQQVRGAMLFFGKAHCVSCHSGPSFNAMNFYALGVNDLYQIGGLKTSAEDNRNKGRGGFTGKEEDMFKFKVPQLYNLKDTPFYFHGSSKNSIREVVEYFNEAIPENENVPANQIAPRFQPLHLSETEIDDLVSFLSDALHDPNLERYVPEYILSGNCFPNNDPLSRLDIGCD
jgi:cytochrome c peroxidase